MEPLETGKSRARSLPSSKLNAIGLAPSLATKALSGKRVSPPMLRWLPPDLLISRRKNDFHSGPYV